MSTEPRRAALAFIFVTVLLDVLGFGLIIPILPKLVTSFVDGDTGRGAQIYGLFGTVWALMQFFASPVLGALSDRFGRRPVILLSNFGLGLDYVLMALAPSLRLLFIGRVISGITAASFPTAGAYIADVTTPEKRAAGFGMLGAAFGLGFIVGPALGGVLGAVDPRLPFWVAAGMSLLNACYGFFVLPESLPPEKRMPFAWKRANPVGSLRLLRSAPGLSGLAVVSFMGFFAHTVLPSMAVIYMQHRYQWTPRDVGFLLGGVGIAAMIVQGGLVGPIVKRFGERRVLVGALIFGMLGFLVSGLAPTGSLYMMSVPLTAFWGLSGPALQGLMTKSIGTEAQGQLQGANACLMGIAELFGPLAYTMTFAYFIDKANGPEVPGAPFLLASACLGAAAVVAVLVTRGGAKAPPLAAGRAGT